jgi:hypothetical protein
MAGGELVTDMTAFKRIAPATEEAAPFPVDISRVMFDLNSTFNPLHPDCAVDFHVSGAKDGYVFLSIALPEGMTRAFVTLLESLVGLVRVIDVKSRAAIAQKKAAMVDPAELKKREDRQAAFRKRVCSLFDDFIAEGLEVNDAVKRTNQALKAKNHPWATYEMVKSTLRASGRFRKKQAHP